MRLAIGWLQKLLPAQLMDMTPSLAQIVIITKQEQRALLDTTTAVGCSIEITHATLMARTFVTAHVVQTMIIRHCPQLIDGILKASSTIPHVQQRALQPICVWYVIMQTSTTMLI